MDLRRADLAEHVQHAGVVRRLLDDSCGNTLAVAAAALFPMLGTIGGGVDFSTML